MNLPRGLQPSMGKLRPRARGYIAMLAWRHLAIGLSQLAAPQWYTSEAFDPFRSLLGIRAWGVLFTCIGAHALLIAGLGRELHARVLIATSSAMTAAWAAGFIYAGASGKLASPLVIVLLTALLGKDLMLSGQPLQPPEILVVG